MMPRFVPKKLTLNPNAPPSHPLQECLKLLLGVLVLGGTIYLFLGLLVDLLIARVPQKIDEALLPLTQKILPSSSQGSSEVYLQHLANQLLDHAPGHAPTIKVHLIQDPTPNAVALPGGHILIFSGLLKKIHSENELALILAHEIGHIVHRDHLRALGRGLLWGLIVSSLGGSASAGQAVGQGLLLSERRYSRQQETAADQFALNLVTRLYGHAGGARELFTTLKTLSATPSWAAFLGTHPLGEDRLRRIEAAIQNNHIPIKSVLPLPADLLSGLEETPAKK